MRLLFKTLLANFVIFLGLVLVIELIFGNWFKNDNFGYSIRESRNVNIPMSVKYDEKKYDYIFQRNNYGFIGKEIKTKEIQAVFLGGSTGEEMFKPYEFSIVGLLNKKLEKENIKLNITNASKGGKSTRGYVNDFTHWFSKISNFNPKIFIFYIGLNDSSLVLPDHFDEPIREGKIEKMEDYVKNNSIFYQLKKKVEHKYFNKLRKYYGLVDPNLYNNFNFLNYENAKQKYINLELNEKNKNVIKNFSQNLNNLKREIDDRNAYPIFITQIQYDGLNNHSLFLVNEFLKHFCEINNYNIIKLDEMNYDLDEKDFYDKVHTTVTGSIKISSLIFPILKKYLIKSFNNYN